MSDKNQINHDLDLIFRKAATDDSFRALCLRDGSAAFKAATGRDAPGKLSFVEGHQGSDVTIVLPPKVSSARDLSEDQLDQVTGGGYLSDLIYGCQNTCRASAGSNSTVVCGPNVPH